MVLVLLLKEPLAPLVGARNVTLALDTGLPNWSKTVATSGAAYKLFTAPSAGAGGRHDVCRNAGGVRQAEAGHGRGARGPRGDGVRPSHGVGGECLGDLAGAVGHAADAAAAVAEKAAGTAGRGSEGDGHPADRIAILIHHCGHNGLANAVFTVVCVESEVSVMVSFVVLAVFVKPKLAGRDAPLVVAVTA